MGVGKVGVGQTGVGQMVPNHIFIVCTSFSEGQYSWVH